MRNIAVMGAGGVGSYVGGLLTKAGQQVTLIDLWPAHIEQLKKAELRIGSPTGEHRVKVHILHIHEVARLHQPFDIVISAVAGYDVQWAMMLMKPLLKPEGWILPLHDGMQEDRIAEVAGRERVLGVVIDKLAAQLTEPGHVVRRRADNPTTFIIGELDGTKTERLEESVQLLSCVAGSVATDNVWDFHWSKIPRDCTRSPFTTLAGLGVREASANPLIRRLTIGVTAEVVSVALALGHKIRAETLLGIEASVWLRAAQGGEGLEAVEERIIALGKVSPPSNIPRTSMALHMATRQRTEIEYLNGYVVKKGRELGIPTPLNSAVTESVQKMERGELQPGLRVIERILAQTG